MAFTNTKESGLESLIVKWLVEQNGYEEGTNADYNKEYAVDETRLFRFLQDTQPKEMDKLGVFTSDTKKRQVPEPAVRRDRQARYYRCAA